MQVLLKMQIVKHETEMFASFLMHQSEAIWMQ